jgi:disulfide bond formation protein DsbB
MLIYARIVMIILLLTSLIGVMFGLMNIGTGWLITGMIGLMWSGFWVWVAWDSWSDMKTCVNRLEGPASF